ncbi:hypothetical protein HF1_03880 [Mycoplasma haemofelis str. Langford 1]|uniref:Uncharacterized protein n=1 Tax=Mycoplasma haemofelis (strain Langford 1) TaxID=941640 RepID=E8ZGX5_MYCHL|nr:hypothetical protein [Mycoplasma haemofelis]CBY92396.1 hypothetical protein HF1_03880 [Mycoplasma haemofelis str. Langford 1]
MSLPIKGAIGGSAVATASAGGIYLGTKYFDSESIKSHLLKSGYKLISSLSENEESPQWEEEFKSDIVKIRALLNISESEDSSGGVKLKAWCHEKMNLKYHENHDDLENVKKYCVIRTLENQLSRNSKTALTDRSDASKWSATYNKRKSTTSLTPRNQIEGLTGEWSGSQESTDLPVIKQWCRQNLKRNFIVKKLGDQYKVIENWCTVEGANVSN